MGVIEVEPAGPLADAFAAAEALDQILGAPSTEANGSLGTAVT